METLQQPVATPDFPFDMQFDIGFSVGPEGAELSDEEFLAAACGAIADIIDKYDAPPEEGGLTNEEIFSRLQGVFDVTSEHYSANEAQKVQVGMRLMEALGHAACGNHELVSGAQQKGLLPEPAGDEHKSHGHDGPTHENHIDADPHDETDPKKKKKKRRQR